MRDYWGQSIPRPLRIGRLGRALEQLTYDTEAGRIFLAALESSAGFAPSGRVRKVTVELVQEGLHQWVFRVQASSPPRNRVLCLTVAKNIGRFSRTAAREWSLLKLLHERQPDEVVRPYEAATIELKEERHPGGLFAYFSHWLSDFWELGLDARHRFALIGPDDVHRLSPSRSEEIRAEMLRLLASLYDPRDGSCLVDVEVNSGDFMGSVGAGPVQLKLIAVRHLRKGLSPRGFLRNLFKPKGDHGDRPVHVVPAVPEVAARKLLDGMTQALGDRDAARTFIRKGIRQAMRRKEELPCPYLDWDVLERLVGSTGQ